jgi:saccharopine dehydrogenase-like NADP-dependent oxidoreductase
VKIAIFGRGRIGCAIAEMLTREGNRDWSAREVGEYDSSIFDEYDVFVCATPWHATLKIAQEVAKREGKIYLDMTEDVFIGNFIRAGSRSIMLPHCGLAPGAVSIIAGNMLPCEDIYVAVGALPVNPVGMLQYAINWSPDGLVNEYSKPCYAILGGVKCAVNALDGTREFGEYEAFNTSGGIGTMVDTLEFSGMRSVLYQTIRYRGHAKLMRFMRDDLGFQHHQEAWAKLLNDNLPHDVEDKVVIDVRGGDNRYSKEIFGANGMSAIQRCTAAGLVSVLLWAMRTDLKPYLKPRNWISMESIPLSEVSQAKCWQECYE